MHLTKLCLGFVCCWIALAAVHCTIDEEVAADAAPHENESAPIPAKLKAPAFDKYADLEQLRDARLEMDHNAFAEIALKLAAISRWTVFSGDAGHRQVSISARETYVCQGHPIDDPTISLHVLPGFEEAFGVEGADDYTLVADRYEITKKYVNLVLGDSKYQIKPDN